MIKDKKQEFLDMVEKCGKIETSMLAIGNDYMEQANSHPVYSFVKYIGKNNQKFNNERRNKLLDLIISFGSESILPVLEEVDKCPRIEVIHEVALIISKIIKNNDITAINLFYDLILEKEINDDRVIVLTLCIGVCSSKFNWCSVKDFLIKYINSESIDVRDVIAQTFSSFPQGLKFLYDMLKNEESEEMKKYILDYTHDCIDNNIKQMKNFNELRDKMSGERVENNKAESIKILSEEILPVLNKENMGKYFKSSSNFEKSVFRLDRFYLENDSVKAELSSNGVKAFIDYTDFYNDWIVVPDYQPTYIEKAGDKLIALDKDGNPVGELLTIAKVGACTWTFENGGSCHREILENNKNWKLVKNETK